jgi:hypothetical protein
MANSNGWGDGAANNTIGWGQGANNAINWGKSHSLSSAGLTNIVGVTTDADAQAFITAAAITDETQKSAINTLVTDLKTDSLWNKMLLIYPFVGGTAQSNSFNLKNTSFGTLTYASGILHGSLGIKGNTANYADTGIKSTTLGITQNSASAGVYMQSWAVNQTMAYGHFGNFSLYRAGLLIFPMVNNGIVSSANVSSVNGFFQSSRNNGSNLLFKDKNNAATTLSIASSALNSTLNLYVCFGNNYNGVSDWISFQYFALGLTETDLTNMYIAVQKFQTTLGRQI